MEDFLVYPETPFERDVTQNELDNRDMVTPYQQISF
jgi:hypothetical protein